jgi:hypothetical protein
MKGAMGKRTICQVTPAEPIGRVACATEAAAPDALEGPG